MHFFRSVLYKNVQLFEHGREYFYILEIPPNGARNQTFAIRYSGWNPGRKMGIPGENFLRRPTGKEGANPRDAVRKTDRQERQRDE
jgi:hypothetical protein